MLRRFLPIVFIFSSLSCVAQSETQDVAPQDIYLIAEQMPSFPGGLKKLHKFIDDNLKYPARAREMNIQGKVYMRFVIKEDGSISNIEISTGIEEGPDLEEEAIRLVKLMPKWEPGKQNGKAVPVSYSLPISFSLK